QARQNTVSPTSWSWSRAPQPKHAGPVTPRSPRASRARHGRRRRSARPRTSCSSCRPPIGRREGDIWSAAARDGMARARALDRALCVDPRRSMFLERKFLTPIERAATGDAGARPKLPAPIDDVVRNLDRVLAAERGIGHVLPDFGLSRSGAWSVEGVLVHTAAELRETLPRYEARLALAD